jgi:predicted RNase H-like nuclease (RuvC/YqgF family)
VQKVAGSNPVRPTINSYGKSFYSITEKGMVCGLAMSGVEVSKEPKDNQLHVCASCVNTVVQTFNHFQEQIAQLKREKASLQKELKKLSEEHEQQKRVMVEEIRALEEKLAKLKKNSESHI